MSLQDKPNVPHFPPVLALIQQAKTLALSTVNQQLLELYWQIGEYLSLKVTEQGWGQSTVKELANWLAEREPNLRGFSAQNLWRMRQFYETYAALPKLSTLLRVLPWSSHLHIMSKCKTDQEREFYLQIAVRERWSVRELEQQINNALFERTIASPLKVSALLRELHPAADQVLPSFPRSAWECVSWLTMHPMFPSALAAKQHRHVVSAFQGQSGLHSHAQRSSLYTSSVELKYIVILAWMPVSSAKDGCFQAVPVLIQAASNSWLSRPCDWIPASMPGRRAFWHLCIRLSALRGNEGHRGRTPALLAMQEGKQ